jgi:hypothetical protein
MALTYELITIAPAGRGHSRVLRAEGAVSPGQVIVFEGRHWLVERVELAGDETRGRAYLKPARYRLVLMHPDGRREAGALRRFRPGAPKPGHAFATLEHGRSVSWQVVDERLAQDEAGEPYVEFVAARDYGELEELPDHELEHALAAPEWKLPEAAAATFSRAEEAGLAVELVALEPGEAPDWEEAERYIDALVLEEIEDDLFELCGVNLDREPRETWLDTVKQRLRTDLERFRDDVEGDHDEIEEWDFHGGRVLASVGSFGDEADPDSGHGWMCRLADSGALSAAGFERVRKAELA